MLRKQSWIGGLGWAEGGGARGGLEEGSSGQGTWQEASGWAGLVESQFRIRQNWSHILDLLFY